MMPGTAPLKLVPAAPVPDHDLDAATRQCVQRRARLRTELAAEDARLTWLRRRLADQRGLGFSRVEAIEREFGA